MFRTKKEEPVSDYEFYGVGKFDTGYNLGYKKGHSAGQIVARIVVPEGYNDLKVYREETSRGVAHTAAYRREMDEKLQEFYAWAEEKFLPPADPEGRRSLLAPPIPYYDAWAVLRP